MNSPALSIAIVDDHSIFRETTRHCLTYLGFSVVLEAENGKKLLDLLGDCIPLPNICLLDIEMPVMDGFATARVLRDQYPAIRIIAFTQVADEVQREKILTAGVHSILLKSAEPQELRDALLVTMQH